MRNVSTGVGSFARTVTSRLSVGVVTAIVTTVVIAGGIAWASVPNNSVTSAKIKDGAVTSADVRNETIRSLDIKDGAVGFLDLAPPMRALMHEPTRMALVQVDSSGATLVSGLGVAPVAVPVERFAAGQFVVRFADTVVDCALVATRVDVADGFSGPGEISVERDNATQVRVRTYDSAGNPADPAAPGDGFSLIVACGTI